jgi:MYXO-CTERM domain-containing protein
MKRLALLGSWKRLGIQLGAIAGLGLALIGDEEKTAVAGGKECFGENECSFKKPNFLIIMDYSSSMNADFDDNTTRWEAAVDAVQAIVTANNGFFDDSMHLALMRFGHDPDPANPGTTIPNEGTGIIDGQSLDVHWYDPVGDPGGYFECNGDAIADFLESVEAPLCQGANCFGIGTWTDGALLYAQSLIAQTRADHPTDTDVGDERFYATMVVTDGNWTDPAGAGQSPANNPVDTAGDLFTNDTVPTYVVAFGDAAGLAFADEMAEAGGTMVSIQPMNPMDLTNALQAVINDITDDVIVPICVGGLPRIMVVLDTSSSMLNVNAMAGAMGTTGWDQARDALVGANALFDVEVGALNSAVEDLVHLGLITYKGDGVTPDTQVSVNYGPCMRDNFAWATDPNTACGVGCNDPWGGPPITWTFIGPGDAGYPGFDQATYNDMPNCDVGGGLPGACTGSGTWTHAGLQLANDNAAAYRANPPALYPVDPTTTFANILITDGAYAGYSTDAQVAAELTDMFSNADTTTYVIGFGDAVANAELTRMACWGSGGVGVPNCAGGALNFFDANNQDQLEDALQTIIESINFDPCCNFNDCSFNDEPTTGEPDPVDPSETGSQESSSGGESSSGEESTGKVTVTDTDAESSSTDDPTDATDTDDPTDATDTDDPTDATDTDDPSDPDTSGSNSNTDTNNPTDPSDTNDEDTNDDSSESSGGTGVDSDDGGCGCSTESSERGLLGTLMTFGLALGFRRRRRS